MLLGITLLFVLLGIVWFSFGLTYAYLAIINAGLRDMPFWYALPVFLASIVLGPFAERVIDPILNSHFPIPEDETASSDDAPTGLFFNEGP